MSYGFQWNLTKFLEVRSDSLYYIFNPWYKFESRYMYYVFSRKCYLLESYFYLRIAFSPEHESQAPTLVAVVDIMERTSWICRDEVLLLFGFRLVLFFFLVYSFFFFFFLVSMLFVVSSSSPSSSSSLSFSSVNTFLLLLLASIQVVLSKVMLMF